MRWLLLSSLLLAGCFSEYDYCNDRTPYLRGGTFVTTAAMDEPVAQLRVEVTAMMERDIGYDEENSVHSPRCFTEAVAGLSLAVRSSGGLVALDDLGKGDYHAELVGYAVSYTVEHAAGMEVVDMPRPFDPTVTAPSGQDATVRWTVDMENLGRITVAIQSPDGSQFIDSQTYPNVGMLTIPSSRFALPGTYRLTLTHTSGDGYGWERKFVRIVDVVRS